jgi:hypothetical protein
MNKTKAEKHKNTIFENTIFTILHNIHNTQYTIHNTIHNTQYTQYSSPHHNSDLSLAIHILVRHVQILHPGHTGKDLHVMALNMKYTMSFSSWFLG